MSRNRCSEYRMDIKQSWNVPLTIWFDSGSSDNLKIIPILAGLMIALTSLFHANSTKTSNIQSDHQKFTKAVVFKININWFEDKIHQCWRGECCVQSLKQDYYHNQVEIVFIKEVCSKDDIISKTCGVNDECRMFIDNHMLRLNSGSHIFCKATRFGEVVALAREKYVIHHQIVCV